MPTRQLQENFSRFPNKNSSTVPMSILEVMRTDVKVPGIPQHGTLS